MGVSPLYFTVLKDIIVAHFALSSAEAGSGFIDLFLYHLSAVNVPVPIR